MTLYDQVFKTGACMLLYRMKNVKQSGKNKNNRVHLRFQYKKLNWHEARERRERLVLSLMCINLSLSSSVLKCYFCQYYKCAMDPSCQIQHFEKYSWKSFVPTEKFLLVQSLYPSPTFWSSSEDQFLLKNQMMNLGGAAFWATFLNLEIWLEGLWWFQTRTWPSDGFFLVKFRGNCAPVYVWLRSFSHVSDVVSLYLLLNSFFVQMQFLH